MVVAARANLVGADRLRDLRCRPFDLLRGAGSGAHLVWPVQSSRRDLARSDETSGLRGVFAAANHRRLHALARLHAGLRLRRRLQSARRAHHDSAARHPAVDSGAQLSARRDAGDGGAVSQSPDRRGDGRNSAHLHRPGLEHGLQLLLFAEEHSARHARGGQDLPLQLVSAVHAVRVALRRDRAGVELDDVGRGRLVFPDGLRDVCSRRPRLSPARTRLVSANRRQRGRHASDLVGRRNHDRGHRAARPDHLASGDRLGGKVQNGAGGERRRAAVVVSQPHGSLARIATAAQEDDQARTRAARASLRPALSRHRRRHSASSLESLGRPRDCRPLP